jgi:hypothetical protein
MFSQTLKGANSNPTKQSGQIRQTQVLINHVGSANKYINSSDLSGEFFFALNFVRGKASCTKRLLSPAFLIKVLERILKKQELV